MIGPGSDKNIRSKSPSTVLAAVSFKPDKVECNVAGMYNVVTGSSSKNRAVHWLVFVVHFLLLLFFNFKKLCNVAGIHVQGHPVKPGPPGVL